MNELSKVRNLIQSGRKKEAWDLLNQVLTENPKNEAAWFLAHSLVQDTKRIVLLEKAKKYLPTDAAIFNQSTLSGFWRQETNPNSKSLKWIYRGLIGLVLFIVCAGIFIILVRNSTFAFFPASFIKPTAFPTQIVLSTPMLRPSPHPLATQALPSEVRYLDSLLPPLRDFIEALERFYQLDDALQLDETMINFQPWRIQVEDALVDIEHYGRELSRTSPVPSSFAIFNKILQDIGAEAEDLAYYYRISITTRPGWRASALLNANNIHNYLDQLAKILKQMQYPLEIP